MGDIASLIAQYGIPPVIIGAILYVLVRWFLWRFEKKSEEKEAASKAEREEAERQKEIKLQEIEKQKEAARQQAEIERDRQLLEVVKELIQGPKHTVEEQKENRRINQFIVKQLDCLIKEGADRAYMFSFHNGGMDVLGRGFLKMSMTEEDVGPNIVPIMARYQNMPRMLFPHLYEQLDEHDFYNVSNPEVIKEDDPFTYQFMIEHNVKSAMFRAIKREDGLMVGFIGMEYITHECVDYKTAGKNIDKKVNRIIGALVGQEIIKEG